MTGPFARSSTIFLIPIIRPEKGGLQYASDKQLAVIIMEPLRGENLAKTPPPEIKKIWGTAAIKRPPVDWALRWIWNHPEVTVILSCMNEMEQIDQNVNLASEVTSGSMTDIETAMVNTVAETFRSIMKVGCISCQYCMPCPAGVNIPGCFEHYNSKNTFKDKSAKLFYLAMLGGS